jgi:hypothetical protein
VVQQLVAAGAQVDAAAAHDSDYRPLHYVAEAGCPTLVAALLQAGADPGSTALNGYTVLHAAASSGSLEVVQQVLGALGSSRAACNGVGQSQRSTWKGEPLPASTPLHLAARAGVAGVVEVLVAAGGDLEQQDDRGCTGLHLALVLEHFHLVPLLVTPANANVCFRLAFMGAIRCYHSAPLEYLARSACLSTQQERPWGAAAAKAATALLAAGADSSSISSQGLTPVLAAACWGPPAMLQVLLEHEVQQQQQQQQQGSTQPLLALLQRLGAHAVAAGTGSTWRMLINQAVDRLGQEGVHALWGAVKQQLQQQLEPLPGIREQFMGTADVTRERALHVFSAWSQCWTAACKDLAAQRSGIVQRVEQLVVGPQQHQPQQGGSARAAAAGKRPRLARELRMLEDVTNAAAAAAAAGGRGGNPPTTQQGSSRSSSGGATSSSRAARAKARSKAAAAFQLTELRALAAGDNKEGVHAILRHLPDRAAGLSAAAAAACGAWHWSLCLQLLRELVMLDEAKGRAAALKVRIEVWEKVPGCADAEQQEEEQQQQCTMRLLQASCQVGDAWLADWVTCWREHRRQLRVAVVAAVTAAATLASPLPPPPAAAASAAALYL